MRLEKMLLRTSLIIAATLAIVTTPSFAGIVEEHATNGVLDLVWLPAFQTPQNMAVHTMDSSDPGYANPSGDHTVGLAVNADLNSGGLIQTITDPMGASDYTWEGWVFTGDSRTRRGLCVRATETGGNLSQAYQFVIDEGLSQFRFRRASLSAGTPSVTNLRLWPVFTLPNFPIPNANEWHKMKVIAVGDHFQCFWDDYELTADVQGQIVDASFPTGFVGCYSFSATNPLVSTYFDDLILSPASATPTRSASWGQLKNRYR